MSSDVHGPAQSQKPGQAELYMQLCKAFGPAQSSQKPKLPAQAMPFNHIFLKKNVYCFYVTVSINYN